MTVHLFIKLVVQPRTNYSQQTTKKCSPHFWDILLISMERRRMGRRNFTAYECDAGDGGKGNRCTSNNYS